MERRKTRAHQWAASPPPRLPRARLTTRQDGRGAPTYFGESRIGAERGAICAFLRAALALLIFHSQKWFAIHLAEGGTGPKIPTAKKLAPISQETPGRRARPHQQCTSCRGHMAHLAASWPDQTLCKENKRLALDAQHKSWMSQREKALQQAATTAPNATTPGPDELPDPDELAEITAFLDGVGFAIGEEETLAVAAAADDDKASSFEDSDEEFDDAAFARYAAARRWQLSSAAADSCADRAVGDDDAETSWATLGDAAQSECLLWQRPSCFALLRVAGGLWLARRSRMKRPGGTGRPATASGIRASRLQSRRFLCRLPSRRRDHHWRGDESAAVLAPPRLAGGPHPRRQRHRAHRRAALACGHRPGLRPGAT